MRATRSPTIGVGATRRKAPSELHHWIFCIGISPMSGATWCFVWGVVGPDPVYARKCLGATRGTDFALHILYAKDGT